MNEHVSEPFRSIVNAYYPITHPCTECSIRSADVRCAEYGCNSELCAKHAYLCHGCTMPFCVQHMTKHGEARFCPACNVKVEAEMARYYQQMQARPVEVPDIPASQKTRRNDK